MLRAVEKKGIYRGKTGGAELAMPPNEIGLGAALRVTARVLGAGDFEPLAGIMQEALGAYLAMLDRHTIEHVMK